MSARHSLGGGLAACAASQKGWRAVTFDAMGIPQSKKQADYIKKPNYIEQKYGLSLEDSNSYIQEKYIREEYSLKTNYVGNSTDNIHNYHNNLDLLTNLQKAWSFAAEAIGTSHNLAARPELSSKDKKDQKVLQGAFIALPIYFIIGILSFLPIAKPILEILRVGRKALGILRVGQKVFGETYINLTTIELMLLKKSLDIHNGIQGHLIPALDEWIKQQEQQADQERQKN